MYNFLKFNNEKDYPMSLSWDVTNRCNMRCKHCFNQSGDSSVYDFEKELTREETFDLVKQIIEIKPEQMCICGGETLLNPYIFEIIEALTSGGIVVSMVSNGLLMTDEVAEKLKKAGVNHIQISVDGLGYQHDTFRSMKGAFQKAIRALDILKKHNMESMVSCCPNKLNYKTFEQYLEYISTTGTKGVRMMPLLPLGRGKQNYEHLLLSSNEMFEFVNDLDRLREKYPKLDIEWGDPVEHLHLVRMVNRKYPVVMSITSTGLLTVTNYIPLYVGDIKKKTLKEYWDAGYKKIWSYKEVREITDKVNCVYDFAQFEEKMTLHLFDD